MQIDLYYKNWGPYNDPSTNERKAELPVSFWFIENYGDDLIEIGEVTDFYIDAKHTVYDLTTERPNTIKMDADDVDYKDKNVLSISTIEHIGNGDYGFPVIPHKAIEILKKMVSDSKNHLISFPIGANRELEEDIIKESIRYFIIERTKYNTWKQTDNKDFNLYQYNYPQYAGNAIAIVTNLDVTFKFKGKKMTEEDFMTIEELGDKFPQDWISNKGLVPYIKRHGENLKGLEIGTCRAESTYYFLDKCPNIDILYTVDPYKAYDDWNGEVTQETLDKFKAVAKKNLKKFDKKVVMVAKESGEAVNDFEDESFDFIFVDGDHSYDATLADCQAYYPKLKKGGIFCGHDYQTLPAVKQSIDDFRNKNKITSPVNLSLNSAFFWYK